MDQLSQQKTEQPWRQNFCTVTVTNAVAITGDHDQVTAALVTAGTKAVVSDATVTISDADAITAAELSAIGGSTTGTVTVTNAVAITGTSDEVTALWLRLAPWLM